MDDLNLDEILTNSTQTSSLTIKPKSKKLKMLVAILGILALLLMVAGVAIYLSLKPINSQTVTIEVVKGDSLSQVVNKLEQQSVVKSAWLTKVYLKIKGLNPQIQVGKYEIPAKLGSIERVLEALKNSLKDTEKVTFYPGATLNFRNSQTDTTPSHREVLKKLGHSDEQIDNVFKSYRNHKLFKLLPEIESLEGLIFGETYEIYKNSSLEVILNKTFDEYVKIIEENNLVEAYKKHNLTLYQGIILASIVEREVYLVEDRPKVAQVFLKRYREGMKLGSDVTYQYASRLAGTENNLFIKSPYNTRQVVGLPPTPIASPSKSSLLAVAKPADTDYLYFVAGDDEKTYFAKTLAEHESFVKRFCIKKCAVH